MCYTRHFPELISLPNKSSICANACQPVMSLIAWIINNCLFAFKTLYCNNSPLCMQTDLYSPHHASQPGVTHIILLYIDVALSWGYGIVTLQLVVSWAPLFLQYGHTTTGKCCYTPILSIPQDITI